MTKLFIQEFISQCIYRVDENTKKITSCLNEMEETEIWIRPNENSNSMGNLILHLCGNIRQYAISSLGQIRDIRERDKEFSAAGGYSKTELIENLVDTIEQAKNIINNISEAELLKTRYVQGFLHTGIGIVIHVTEHYSYHTGQVAFWTKLLRNKDLKFYAGIDLNKKNKRENL